MDIEQKQADLIDHFVKQASVLKGSSLAPVIIEATSNPNLFAFSEILAVPNVAEVFPYSKWLWDFDCSSTFLIFLSYCA